MLWDLAEIDHLRSHLVEHACVRTGSGLNREEWARYIPELPYQATCPS
jgi:hypothetical protein